MSACKRNIESNAGEGRLLACLAFILVLGPFLFVPDTVWAQMRQADAEAAAKAEVSGPRFLLYLPDIPVMPGLSELTDYGASFDKPEGRIAESVLRLGAVMPAEAQRFYARTLPQLGWNPEGKARFFRENEELALEFERNGAAWYLKIRVHPKNFQGQDH